MEAQVPAYHKVAGLERFGVESALLRLSAGLCGVEEPKMNLAGNTASGAKSSRTLVPLLVILFLVSYGLLTTLVIEQDKTIDSQRSLMHLLLKDSFHLSALHKELRQSLTPSATQHAEGTPNAQAPSSRSSVSQLPSNQVPLIQSPSVQVPSTQTGSDRPKARSGVTPDRKAKKAGKSPFVRPPAELTDPSDMRRVSFSI